MIQRRPEFTPKLTASSVKQMEILNTRNAAGLGWTVEILD